MCTVGPAHAETKAGTIIDNVARARYDADGAAADFNSNHETRIVAERLDVTLMRQAAGPIPADATAIAVTLTNRGNGQEAFDLAATGNGLTGPGRFAIDVDGDGRYDPAIDQLLAIAHTAPLAPGDAVPLLLLADPGGVFRSPRITIVATAATGSGPPGTEFPGQGDGGGDAETGPTGARAEIGMSMSAEAATPTLFKTQSVTALDGSTRPLRGASVTYTLTASFPTDTVAARIDDPVPAGATYQPGTLTLDGTPLSDAADGDAGTASQSAIAASLGDLPAGTVRTLQFKVRIQ